MKAFVVLGYGIYQKESAYTRYLDCIAEIVSSEKPDVIVLTGGKTNKHFPELSEAASMKAYLEEKGVTFGDVLLEEESVSTLQNILGAKKLLPKSLDSLHVVCDSTRVPKVIYLTLTHLLPLTGDEMSEEEVFGTLMDFYEGGPVIVDDTIYVRESITVHGISWERTREEIGTQILSSMIEVGVTKYPELQKKADLMQRKKFEIE